MNNSILYKHLIFLRDYSPPEYSVVNIYFFILGYQLNNPEEWVEKFVLYLEIELLNKYFNNSLDRLPNNFGIVIMVNQGSIAEGINEFYHYLQKYKDMLDSQ